MIESYKKYEPLFGDWKIKRLIGKGSFGEVYEIERDNFGTIYKAALKAMTIPADENELNELMTSGMSIAETKEYIKQSARDIVSEFDMMSRLKGNTNIVSYEDHQVIEHEDKLGWDILMKMELLEPISKYIKTHTLTLKDVIRLGIDLCTALELCERYHIVHRDIKPENIFVSPNGDFKLGDFGIARSMEKATMGLSKKGTYTYMAPEVYKGEDYTTTIDIYSLGIVMYRFLNHNRVPFMPKYPAAIAYTDRENALIRRMNGEKIPPPDCQLNEKLVEIVLKACQFDPHKRYENAIQMKEALEEVLEKSVDCCLIEAGKIVSVGKSKAKAVKVEVEEEIEKTVLLDREETLSKSISITRLPAVEKKRMVYLGAITGGLIAVIIGVTLLVFYQEQGHDAEVKYPTHIDLAEENTPEQEVQQLPKETPKEIPKEIPKETPVEEVRPSASAPISSHTATPEPEPEPIPSISEESPVPSKEVVTPSPTPAAPVKEPAPKKPTVKPSPSEPPAPKPSPKPDKPPEIYIDFD